jgi:hypothetical protein
MANAGIYVNNCCTEAFSALTAMFFIDLAKELAAGKKAGRAYLHMNCANRLAHRT